MLYHIDNILIEVYYRKEITMQEIADKIGYSSATVGAYFKRQNLTRNKDILKNSIKHNFFSKIESEIQAYLLGFFVADGSIGLFKQKYSNIKRLSISVQEGDKYIIDLYKQYISPLQNLSWNKGSTSTRFKNGKVITIQPSVGIKISSEQIYNDLTLLGYGKRKTYSEMSLPNISNALLPHFIRGYFDGDGCINVGIGFRKNGKPYNNFNCTILSKKENILVEISKYLFKNGISSSIAFESIKVAYTLNISGRLNVLKFKNLIYTDSHYYLERKFLIFKGIPLHNPKTWIKLTEAQIKTVTELLKDGRYIYKDITRITGVSKAAISRIKESALQDAEVSDLEEEN